MVLVRINVLTLDMGWCCMNYEPQRERCVELEKDAEKEDWPWRRTARGEGRDRRDLTAEGGGDHDEQKRELQQG